MRSRNRRQIRAFTLIDLCISIVLMAALASLMAHAWDAFGRAAMIAVARARLAQESNLAAESLARDVGRIARSSASGLPDDLPGARFEGSGLSLRIDDGTENRRTILYEVDDDDPGKLFRTEDGQRRVVAGLIAGFRARAATRTATSGGPDVPGVEVELTFSHRVIDRDPDGSFRGDYSRRYVLFIEDDSP